MIKVYKLKTGTIIPDAWNTEIKNGKLEYWCPVNGGYKKTKVFESVELDIPKKSERLSWLQIVKINLKYGEALGRVYAENRVAGIVCLTYLRAKTALYQKASEFINQMDGENTFFTAENFFEQFSIFDYFPALGGLYSLDTLKLDEILDKRDPDYNSSQCTFRGKKNVSMKWYIRAMYGELTEQAVKAMI